LEQAAKDEDGQHLEIFDHLAEAQLKLGEKKAAVETWQKALKLDDISPRDKTRRADIKKKIDANP